MTYGFIGLGNMAGAILRGMHRSGAFAAEGICGYNRSEGKTLALQAEIGLEPCSGTLQVAQRSDIVVLAVKPQMMDGVLQQIAPALRPEQLVISIAAGKPTSYYEAAFPAEIPVVRVMPNINAKVCAATSAVCGGKYAAPAHLEIARKLFSTVGSVFEIPEAQFAAFSAIGGASGAFIHIYIDALASAGVKAGLPRPLAQDIACQTVLGSARLTAESGEHPIALVDQVCSPGGTTIEGVHTLKRLGFETAIQQAVDAIIAKDHKLGQ